MFFGVAACISQLTIPDGQQLKEAAVVRLSVFAGTVLVFQAIRTGELDDDEPEGQ